LPGRDGGHESPRFRDEHAYSATDLPRDFSFIGREKDTVALLDVQLRLQRGLLGVIEKLHDRRFPFTALSLDEGEALGAMQLCNFGELIGLPDCDSGESLCVDCFYDAAGIECTAKNFEIAFTKCLT